MTENLIELCRGHIIHTLKRCRGCKNDEYNRRCEYYKPLYILMFKIEERPPVGEAACDFDAIPPCEDADRFDERGMYR